MANAILNRMDRENGRFFYQDQVFTTSDLILKLDSERSRLEDWENHLLNFLKEWTNPYETIEVKTSGSTGVPKLIKPFKKNLSLSAQSTNRYFQINSDSRLIACLPANYIAGKMMIVRALEAKCILHLQKPGANPFKGIQFPVDFIALTPHQLKLAIQQKSQIERVKKILIGGERISASLMEQIQGLSSKCYASFGMTETLSHIAIQSLNHPYNTNYQTLSGVQISLDKRSCLQVKTPWTEQIIQTNDQVEIINHQEFKWLGRLDDVINSGGIKLHPAQMEEKIAQIIQTRFCISSIPDETFGEIPVLVIEGDKLSHSDSIRLLTRLNENLGQYEKLKAIINLRHFPETENGKIQRKEIKNRIINNS